jgi:spore germination protein KC
MKRGIRLGLLTLIIFSPMIISGCWNYREVDQLLVVAGVALDKGKTERYAVTVEVIHMSGGKDTKMTP